jgi:hypothetical protein
MYVPNTDVKTTAKIGNPWKHDIAFPVRNKTSASAPLPTNSFITAT